MKKVLNTIQRDLIQRFAANGLNDLELEQVTVLLRRFVRGELNESESNEVIDVLAENEKCMEFLDNLWVQHPIGQALAAAPALDGATALRVQNKLINQIQRSNLTGTMFKMGTQGFFEVAVGLLRPFSRQTKTLQPRRKRNQL
jgi:hypothetical protein